MNTKKLDVLNIGLIILSAILAIQFPLELFIVSFAILGPLHYLTEINWLDKKRYFTGTNNRLWLWIGIAATVVIVFPKLYFFMVEDTTSDFYKLISQINSWTNGLVFMTLLAALGFVIIKQRWQWAVLLGIGLVGAYFLNTNNTYTTIVGLLIPTVVHVYVFTLLFMAYGAKKSKSTTGYISVFIAALIPLVIASANIDPKSYDFSQTMKDIYLENHFHFTPVLLSKFFGWSDGTTFYFYETLEMRLMMFLSFIYFYHYLNWFSKTTVINWHKNLTVRSSIAIAVLWITLLGLFYYDYKVGFIAAIFFNFAHVILEFPLNIVSIKGLIVRTP